MSEKAKNILLSLAVLGVSYFLVFEVVARLFVQPTLGSYGTLFGIELPPFDVAPPTNQPDTRDRAEWFEGLVVDGKRITVGDLWGYYREDPLLGYAPLENTTSLNAWWEANSIGAMARHEIPPSKQEHGARILVFGESFTS